MARRSLCQGERAVKVGRYPAAEIHRRVHQEIRWAKDRGAAGVFFRGIEGNLTLDNPYFFPVYQAASDLDLPICIHQGSGSPTFINFLNLERNRQWSHSAVLPLFAFNDIVNNKIPELFPRLKFGFIEAYASWIPYLFTFL